ncbi:ribokinase [Sporolactobacillus terrae]|uniref:ribokinase n=1 Tax=Sporolactobacillus terrae TaxID=269673 RepID=UPI00111A8EA0|nr:ribokinase [Sporolactobacillus terrae]
MNKVAVLGSINVDSIFQLNHLPLPGETITVESKRLSGGGKGANQAIAAARSGAKTAFIGKIGNDDHGRLMIECLGKENINTAQVTVSHQLSTGEAYILLDQQGQNSIIVSSGSNQALSDEDVDRAQNEIVSADFLVTQLEIPECVTVRAFHYAKRNHVMTILNPAPAKCAISLELLTRTDLIVPNETESEQITGIKIKDEKSLIQSSEKSLKQGVKAVIITLGEKGAFFCTPSEHGLIQAFSVLPVDTTAAGDTFIGALCARLRKDFSNLREAIIFANKVSSLTVQKLGAISSIPTLTEIQKV